MKRIMFVCLLWAVLLICGCDVKEDRGDCPCRLVLDFSGVDADIMDSAVIFLSSAGGFAFSDRLDGEALRAGFDVPVPRERIDVCVWSGDEGMFGRRGLVIPAGEDCPPVCFHLSSVEASGEAVCDTVRLRKNHCVMRVNLTDLASEHVLVMISGNVEGYTADGKPSAGLFSYLMQLGDGTGGEVILPRQLDDSLMMEIHDGTGVVRRFAIGEYIAESGYDWSAPDLQDIELDMDIAVTGIDLLVRMCAKVFEYELVI